MKSLRLFLLTIPFLLSTTAFARDYLIALSPFQTPQSATDQVKTLIPFLAGLDEGDTALIIDGYDIKTIGEFIIPRGQAYQSAKARLAKNRTTIAALMQFANASGGQEDMIYFPKIMRHAALIAAGKPTLDVIVIGSPLHRDFTDYKFTMTSGRFPSDGHIRASRNDSPYGTKGYETALENVRIHFGIKRENELTDDRQRYVVERFWTLYVAAMGGKLVSFTSDLPTIFSRVKNNVSAPDHGFILEQTDKLEMIDTNGASIGYIFSEPASSAITHPIDNMAEIKLGLSWNCAACDFDLYAGLKSSREAPLSYGNTVTSLGNHWKITNARTGAHFAEAISFNRKLDPKDLVIAVNLYSGFVEKEFEAELRMSIDGKLYAKTIPVSNLTGNKGADVPLSFESGTSRAPQTFIVHPLEFFKG